MNVTAGTSSAFFREVLSDLGRFLRRPEVREPMGLRSRSAWMTLGILYLLHVAVLLLLTLPLTALIQRALGLAPPDAFNQIPDHWLLPITVLIAPVLEELVFRSWQSGRPRAIWLLVCGVLAGLLLIASTHGLGPLWAAGGLLIALVAAATGWFKLRRRATPASYRKIFPVVYWAIALLFAGIHVMNYGNASALTALLVVPQLWAGIMLGYTRQKLGVGAGMIQHASANAAAMALALVAGM